MLQLDHITKTFISKKNLHKSIAVDDVSLSFENGVYGLLGPNGSGKTTLLRCITGMYRYKGKIAFDGKDVSKYPAYTDEIGYLPQAFDMFRELTLYEMLSYFAALKHIKKSEIPNAVESALETVNLTEKRDCKTGALSGGMKRRAGIAQALLGNPSIIILDEPTTGLDVEERLRFKNIIANIHKEKTVILSTHIIEDVEALCDRIVILHNGKLLADGTRNQIVEAAVGKVYAFDEQSVPDNVQIQKIYEVDGQKKAKVLSNRNLGGEPLRPTVEDGYLCYIKNI